MTPPIPAPSHVRSRVFVDRAALFLAVDIVTPVGRMLRWRVRRLSGAMFRNIHGWEIRFHRVGEFSWLYVGPLVVGLYWPCR